MEELAAAYESSPREKMFIDRGEYGPEGRDPMHAYRQAARRKGTSKAGQEGLL